MNSDQLNDCLTDWKIAEDLNWGTVRLKLTKDLNMRKIYVNNGTKESQQWIKNE
jgi:hypothetical protein